MQETVNETLLNLVLAVVTLLASYGLFYIRKGIDKLKVETAKIESDDQRQLIQDAITRLDDIASKTVMTIEQTTAKELRRAVKLGEVDPKRLKNLFHTAYADIIKTIEPQYYIALRDSIGDLDKYITSTIEAKVLEMKQNAVVTEVLELRGG
ncbi:guanylate kinase [Paenibacillus sp. NPDC057967]|uniref:guanylate kinase n=1 Tax=Paenibacillus sp. NPDC057967 TaxID=3346293 RepID=UPI0036DE63E2